MTRIGVISSTGKIGSILTRDIIQDPKLQLVAYSQKYSKDQHDTIIQNSEQSQSYNPDVGNQFDLSQYQSRDRQDSLYTSDMDILCSNSDVVIDFSHPTTLEDLLHYAKKHNTPLVIGTTGFTKEQMILLERHSITVPTLYSANMSIGIHLISRALSHISKNIPQGFDLGITEVHHKDKKDQPSGTALMLGRIVENKAQNNISYSSLRMGGVYGEHSIIMDSLEETITFSHRAKNRELFAKGAISAALWLIGHNIAGKLYDLSDVMPC